MNNRYTRQIILPEIGEAGQKRLAQSKALVVGTGGLGSPVLFYLSSAGVGEITIVDSDIVDITNLNRQFIHFEKDIGRDKAQSAYEKIKDYNSQIKLNVMSLRLNDENAMELIKGYDIVILCVDNLPTRYLLNECCVKLGIPMIDSGVTGFDGYVLTIIPHITPCYRCIFPENAKAPEIFGIVGATAGVAGTLMSMQAIKYILGIDQGVAFMFIDLLNFSFIPINIDINPDCPVCGKPVA